MNTFLTTKTEKKIMTRSHCYCFSGIIISLLIHTLASPPLKVCLPDQRDALLEFKDEFPIEEFPIEEFDPIPWNKSSTDDCCFWKGVTCDDRSGQVISLNLFGTLLNGSLKTNSSLFRFQYLRHLNLSYCYLQGEIPSSLGNLSRLTLVDLSHNDLVGDIPVSIGNLKRLRHVNLGDNTLTGAIPSSIGNLNQLRYLSLGINQLIGEIPSSIGNLSYLFYLQLSTNSLVGQVPASIGNLNRLQVMSLGQNNLNGTIPISLANLTKLYHISLRSNNFTSKLPSEMSGFHSLIHFDISNNSFYGPFPNSLFSIPSLQTVSLEENQFTGPIEFPNTSFSSSSAKLEELFLASNKFDGLIPESISKFINLKSLYLQNNNFTGPIHRSMSKLDNLYVLDLSNNMLEGEVPACLWRLETVTLSRNVFSSFENPLQETLIQALDLNSNSFRGPFPHWICKTKGLSFLDLSNNLFNGSIPPCFRNSIDTITDLILRNNSFSGTLPDIFANATELRSLDVSRSQLEGTLPKSLVNCKALQLVNVEGNRIKDVFPSWLRSLPSLHVLILRSNEFYGPLYHPHESVGFQRLRVIDISHNDFTGTLPPHWFSSWREMTKTREEDDPYMADIINDSVFYRNSMVMVIKGVETSFERIQQDFRAIDFSGNRIYGEIPESLCYLKELHLLNLSGNGFTRGIPRFLANLTKLETLDLSCNKLSGQIPQDLGELSSLSYMNFSGNFLEGPVPRGTQFQRQSCSSFSDNARLFGLEEICGKSHGSLPVTQQQLEEVLEDEQLFNWVAAAIAYGPGVFCGLVIGHIFTSCYHKSWSKKTQSDHK